MITRDEGLKIGFFPKRTYQYPSSLSIYDGLFRCSYPLRFDTYKQCYVGCHYCFANLGRMCILESKELKDDLGIKEIAKLNNILYEVLYEGILEGKEEIVRTMLSRKIPILFGTITEIFQPKEKWQGITYEALKVFLHYKYPLNISTKCGILADKEYRKKYLDLFDKFDRDKFLFRISLIGLDNDKIKTIEPNAPSVENRLEILKEVNEMGIETIVRIQPFIFGISDVDIERFFESIKKAGTNTITIEGFKLNNNLLKYCDKKFAEYVKKDCIFLNGFYVYDALRLKEAFDKIDELAKKYEIEVGYADSYFLYRNVNNVNCCGNKTKIVKSEWTVDGFSWYMEAVREAEKIKDYYVLTFNDVLKHIPSWIDRSFSLSDYHSLFYKKGILLSKGKQKKEVYYKFKDFVQKNYNDIGQYHSFSSDLRVCLPIKNGKPIKDKFGNYIYLVDWKDSFKNYDLIKYDLIKVEFDSLSERVKKTIAQHCVV